MIDFTKGNAAGQALSQDQAFGKETRAGLEASLFCDFACERMSAFRARQEGVKYDSKFQTINEHRYTNPYRMLDRVSQALIHDIALDHSLNNYEKAFCCYVFRVFNEPATYRSMLEHLGSAWSPQRGVTDGYYVGSLITLIKGFVAVAKQAKMPLYRPAYKRCTAVPFDGYFELLVEFCEPNFSKGFRKAKCLAEFFDLLTSLYGFGPFLSYQLALDWNYCLTKPLPIDFVVPGPGAKRGLAMVFGSEPISKNIARIKWITRNYHDLFKNWRDFELNGKSYPLKENDVQNLFCEFSKFFGAHILKDSPKRKLASAPSALEIKLPGQYAFI